MSEVKVSSQYASLLRMEMVQRWYEASVKMYPRQALTKPRPPQVQDKTEAGVY